MSTVYLNGQWLDDTQAMISVHDRGFLFADGIYEVIPVYHGKPFRLQEHLTRLNRSLVAIDIANPFSLADWEKLLLSALQKNSATGHQKIYLQITRGQSPTREFVPSKNLTPTVFVKVTPAVIKPLAELAQGCAAMTLKDLRWARCDIKSIALLAGVLASREAKAHHCEEAILIRDDHVTEGASSNIFMVKNGVIHTPPSNNEILGGITREFVIELIHAHSLAFTETQVSTEAFFHADEIWITSSTREIMPVVKLNERPVGTGKAGPIWQQVIAYYHDAIAHL